ncbi:hypothetical protein [Clostridium brassicae]|uniref:HNH endonuclease n=1 Tax=Clostridium brassicae TaxID=2999072 RepID=A0ABT4D566_9CLOT|nr:hypothetical protein [Clostridium brassicae]MCY6957431.1 hypothetical protein [Clostridium brassicae]
MDISKYIQEYDFYNYFEKIKKEFKQQVNIQKYLENNSEENFVKFSQEFWENTNISVNKLKEKYNVSKQIAFSDIIKAYPTDKYIKLLKMYYNNSPIENLISEFAIPYNRIEKIIVSIVIDSLENYCPKCFNDSFEIESDLEGRFIFKCQQCNKKVSKSDLLTIEQAKMEMERITEQKIRFEEKIEEIEKDLNNIKCPKCQEKLYLKKNNDTFSYEIKCDKCNYISNDIENTIKDFKEWKQRAAMMIAIKAKEQELIEKALEIKKEQDVLFTKENIITSLENSDTLDFLNHVLEMDNMVVWSELFKRIKACNRLEKMMLSKIIELAKESGEKSTYRFKDKEIIMYGYIPQEPIIYDLINKTKILVARQIIRKLMKQNFVLLSEEQNYIFVPEILINNLETINNLMVVKDINSSIRYLVFQRQSYTCMTCGETGRPLKIAYMTSDKNINNLNNLIALCDNCYDIMTKNQILIDGTITFEVDYLDNNNLKSFEFLTYYYPELKTDETIRKTLYDWENYFSLTDIIKALTITIDKIKRNKMDGTVNTLFSYTNAILKNNNEAGTHVNVYDSLKEQYNLEKWIEDI